MCFLKILVENVIVTGFMLVLAGSCSPLFLVCTGTESFSTSLPSPLVVYLVHITMFLNYSPSGGENVDG